MANKITIKIAMDAHNKGVLLRNMINPRNFSRTIIKSVTAD